MKAAVHSKCEREFVQRTIEEGKRLDGRHTYDYRQLKITFGLARGSCQVHLGLTRVFAQVSIEVAEPKPGRPNEGLLFVNVELSPMAAPNFEAGRMSEAGLEVNRLIERCIINSRAIDLESLCIVAGEKTWAIRVDVHVLNHDGNIVDCASIAAIAALCHFRRPDVTVSGEQVTIHNMEDRQPVPLSCHHMPVCITFAFFDDGKYLIVDPTEREENVMLGKMVVAMNIYREICMLHLGGLMSLHKDQIFRCTQIACGKTIEIVEQIKSALALDARKRLDNKEEIGFVQLLKEELIVTSKRASVAFRVNLDDENVLEADIKVLKETPANPAVSVQGRGTASIGGGGTSTWDMESDNGSASDNDDVEEIDIGEWVSSKPMPMTKCSTEPKTEIVDLSEDSEEDSVVILDSADTRA